MLAILRKKFNKNNSPCLNKILYLYRAVMIIFRLIRDSSRFAIQALTNNKLRTLLSLLGITIGIFAIIFVLTTVDSMEKTIKDSMRSLGRSTIFIQKWPWGFGGEYQWWEYMNRPVVTLKEMQQLENRVQGAEAFAFLAGTNGVPKYRDRHIASVDILGVSHNYNKLEDLNLSEGRYFTFAESQRGGNVSLLGFDVASELFPNSSPIGKQIRLYGRKITVAGVIEKKGLSNFGDSPDEQILLPVNYLRTIFNLKNENLNPTIMTRARKEVPLEFFNGELTAVMRSLRSLPPNEKDNFAINEVNVASENLNKMFNTMSLIGWFIGGIAIFVGGFGIANIMFVSVKERTKIIGIQKAIGAKNYFILLQFLFESVILSLIGGLLGLFFVWISTVVLADIDVGGMEFTLYLNQSNILLGLAVSITVGILAGITPALQAAHINPVEAIRTGN
ncbi:MAG: ABC transporter permease [Bacteroidales bacterium]